jgi:hypothetical protein
MKELLKTILQKYEADRVFICRVRATEEKFNTQQPVLYIDTVDSILAENVEPFKYRGKSDHYIYKYSDELRKLFLEEHFYFCEDLRVRDPKSLTRFENMYLDNKVYTARAFLLNVEGYFLVIQWSGPYAKLPKKELNEELKIINLYYNFINSQKS